MKESSPLRIGMPLPRLGRLAWLATNTVVLASLLAGCATPPPPAPVRYSATVVLLDNDDGTTGKVHVSGSGGMTVLDRSHEATFIGSPTGTTFDLNDGQLQKDFGPALAASPIPPTHFLMYFDFGSTKLTAESRALLPKILDEVGKRPAPDVSVIGHTDTVGDDPVNEALGLSRAKLVADMLAAGRKIEPSKIALESHGKRNLLVPTPDKTVEPRNRRVEVTVR
ncbi:MAG: conserved hypothetical secreted protein [Rhizobacter sp.]|nr:conserved hypothetical secreted protein [Rhizobacter sp.]